jgi:putative transposase
MAYDQSPSCYYVWSKRPSKLIDANKLMIYRRAKALFKASHKNLGSRELAKKIHDEGFNVGRYRARTLMRKLKLKVTQREDYKVTTQRKHSDSNAAKLLDQNFNPTGPNQVWAGDFTYMRTGESWIYLAIVMDLYSRRIIGWAINKHMTTALVERALTRAVKLRRPPYGVVFHSDRGLQYASKRFQSFLRKRAFRSSMVDVGACWGTQYSIFINTLLDLTRAGIAELPLR